MEHAPDEVLERGYKYKPRPWHDLQMVVYTIFQQSQPLVYPLLLKESRNSIVTKTKVAWIKKFRQVYLSHSPWKEMLQLAKDTKYEDLKNKIKDLPLRGFKCF